MNLLWGEAHQPIADRELQQCIFYMLRDRAESVQRWRRLRHHQSYHPEINKQYSLQDDHPEINKPIQLTRWQNLHPMPNTAPMFSEVLIFQPISITWQAVKTSSKEQHKTKPEPDKLKISIITLMSNKSNRLTKTGSTKRTIKFKSWIKEYKIQLHLTEKT